MHSKEVLMDHREALTAYVAAFVDELAQVGVKHAVVSPGSRSTPFALLLSKHEDIHVHMNIDERSAGFFALGLAKALKEPVVLLCTSGTAAANYYPAVIEASYSRVPLIVLTADRPHELREVGAPQAIDQIHLYGKHVKWFAEMPLPENNEDIIRFVRSFCARAASTALQSPRGPVHLNFPLREPLVPIMGDDQYFHNNRGWGPFVSIQNGELTVSEMEFKKISEDLTEQDGIIVCGFTDHERFAESVTVMSEKLGYPILADPLSQLRSGSHAKTNIIDCYDTFLRFEEHIKEMQPKIVIRFGAMPVSKALTLYLKKHKAAKHYVVDGGAEWRDPVGTATHMVYCDEALFCDRLIQLIEKKENMNWLKKWRKLNEVTKSALQSIRDEKDLNEGKLFSILGDLLPIGTNLFVSNSMPIRDLDTFFHNNDKDITIYANRGANGIDGTISTALGISTVKEPTVLVLGDLSFFHDSNGLLAAKLQKQNLTIVLVNNDGGGIFSFLPQSSEEKYFEQVFGTPHGLDFSHLVALYGGTYVKARDWEHFEESLQRAIHSEGLNVIEVRTDRQENVMSHRRLWNYVSREILLSNHGEINENSC